MTALSYSPTFARSTRARGFHMSTFARVPVSMARRHGGGAIKMSQTPIQNSADHQSAAKSISYRPPGRDTCHIFRSTRGNDSTMRHPVIDSCRWSSTYCEAQSSDRNPSASSSVSGPGSGSDSGLKSVPVSTAQPPPNGVFLKRGVIPLLTFGDDGKIKLDIDPDRSAPGNSSSENSTRSPDTSVRPETKKKASTRAPNSVGPDSNVPKWKLPSPSGKQKDELQKSVAAPKYSKAQRRFFNENFRDTERLSKLLASVGVASRRASEGVIFAGRVTVNGQVCLVPQTAVDLGRDAIEVDGQPLPRKLPPRMCFVVNKPKGYICTSSAEGGGTKLALDLVEKYMKVWGERNTSLPKPRLFTVGRLDVATTGLLIITNDGDLAQKVGHPSSGLTKEYVASVDEKVTRRQLALMSAGTVVDGVQCIPAEVSLLPAEMGDSKSRIKIVVNEGRNHEVRNIVANGGLEVRVWEGMEGDKNEIVKALKRVRIGGLRLSRKLAAGKFEVMVPSHLERLLFGTTETLV